MAVSDTQEAKKLGLEGKAHNLRHSVSIYLLIGFATELLLKVAYALTAEKSDWKKFGHDLEAAMASLSDCGFVFDDDRLVWLVKAQQEAHQKFFHRYDTAPPNQQVPDLSEALAILENFTNQIERNYPDVWDS